MVNKADWPLVREKYITGNLTLLVLAESTGWDRTTVRRKAAKEGWAKQREDYQRELANKVRSMMSTRMAEEYVEELMYKRVGEG